MDDLQQDVNLLDYTAEAADLGEALVALTRYNFEPAILARFHAYLTDLDLLNLQACRDLLRQNLLPAEENLRVSRVAILFTALRGSTALYAIKGDPGAYGLVREHFAVLFAATHAQRGAVVKTIGD